MTASFADRLRSELGPLGLPEEEGRGAAVDPSCTDVARATPVYFVGDSQTLVFRDRIYRLDDEYTSRHFVARTLFVPGLCASNFTAANGSLHREVENALRSELLVVDEESGRPVAIHRTTRREWREIAGIEGRSRSSPIVVFVCGSLDVALISKALMDDASEIPDPSPMQAIVSARSRVRPLERGLRLLRSWGLDRIFVHSVCPPQDNDAAVAAHFAFRLPLQTRRRLLRQVNLALEEAAQVADCGFIDGWTCTMQSDTLRADFAHDGFHFNERAALISMELLVRALRAPASQRDGRS